MKKYVLPLFMFLAALFLTVTAAASDVLGLHDGAKLLQTSERTAVMKELQDVEKRYGVGMAIITVPSTNKMKIGDYANKLLDSTFKDGKKGNMVLVLAMDTRDYYIATDKAMKERITDAKGIPALEENSCPLSKRVIMPEPLRLMPGAWENSWLITKKTGKPMIRKAASARWPWPSPWP